ncbi:hypothetical protein DVH24_010377 [Malus domestica]|uniref:Uncharacterized protein n=1 Tax=Malus domestica TaxID=3750 RepID=A0A498JX39_MALDO|nr:hypothetical protein DVH24_010377 [Malus domestica]
MAEITEPLLPPKETPETSKPLEPADDFDPKTMRRITPGLKRLIITVSVLFSFILVSIDVLLAALREWRRYKQENKR